MSEQDDDGQGGDAGPPDQRARRVPARRASRLARMGGLGARLAGRALSSGAKAVARGERPDMGQLMLTPANAARVADELSNLRGAAMKFGQLLSMDAGDFLPPEWSDILARLREAATPMPPAQLRRVLNEEWGRNWLSRLERFDARPMAAASIGQVHRAVAKDGREMAVKVQYPGVAKSIDSDIDNISSLLKISGLVPKTVDLDQLLDEAKERLRAEADYRSEAAMLSRYRDLLNGAPQYRAPALYEDFTTSSILAMERLDGARIESFEEAGLDVRNRIVSLLIDLLMREQFEFALVQTDPNLGNYRYDAAADQLILFDFGATQEVAPQMAAAYRDVLAASLEGDFVSARERVREVGYLADRQSPAIESLLADMFALAFEPMREDRAYDFGASDLSERMRDVSLALRDAGFAHTPPRGVIFLHRKFGGLYLIASRLKARVNVRALIEPYVTPAAPAA